MSKSSGTADEILNLPSGGGSVSGSGSSFSVDLNTGTLTAGLDLALPTGPNGIAPSISLQYSAAAGDGPFGLGWSMGMLMISRKITPSTVGQDLTAVGTYSMSGVGDLVDMGSGRYRPTVDSTGQLIEFVDGSWVVTDNKDSSFTLGTTPNSQIGSDPPAAWLLDKCSDSSGNAVSYSWLNSAGEAPLPNTVAWGTYQLVFQYETRPDLSISGSYGAPLQISQRCSSIELHVTTEAASLVRSWQLLYNDDNGLGRSRLQTIREQGHAADGTVLAAPDRTLTYTVSGEPSFVPVTGFTSPLNDIDTDLVDLNGDGLPDILSLGAGLPTMHPNLGGGQFGYPRPLSQVPSSLRLSASSVAFADMSGSGNADLLVLDQTFSGYYSLSTPGGSAPSGFGLPVVFQNAPNVMPGDPRVRLLDLNGDGITDILYDTGRAWLMYLRDGVSSWEETPRFLPAALTPPVSLTDTHVYLADMTGDGYTDIVLINGGGVTYWPARADGGWDAPVTMAPAPALGQDFEPLRMSLFDVDGDGCADLVYVGSMSVTVWLNTGANRLSEPTIIDDTPFATPGSYRLVDLLGQGTVGIHFELPQVRPGQTRQTFLDLNGGVKPNLLSDITAGLGQTTHITYRTSTSYAMEDEQAGARWATYHPFPLQCVAQTDQKELGTGLTMSVQYRYHDGRYDPSTRVFLGFGKVDAEQLGDDTCPTLRSETVFHLGLDPDDPTRPLLPTEAFQLGALRRKVLSTTAWGMDGSSLQQNPYTIVSNTYDTLLVVSNAADGGQVAVPYLSSSTEERWERQDTVLSTRATQYLEVTTEGDVTKQKTTATRTGAASPDQDVISLMTFATGGKNLRLPARVTQTTADGSVICANVTYYDGDPYVGLPEGQAAIGLETLVEDLAFTDDFVAQIWGASPPDLTQYGYHRQAGDTTGWWMTRRAHQRSSNSTGPVLSTKGPLGAVQTTQLDSLGQRTVSVTDAVGNTLTSTTNARIWQTESITDQNGQTTTDVFDSLGRVTATIHPLDSPALPWASYEFAIGAVSAVTANMRVVHGQPETIPAVTFVDGSGNNLGKASPSANAGQWVIAHGAALNVRGLVTQTFFPYEVSAAVWAPAPAGTGGASVIYDALGRAVQKTRADGLVAATRRQGDTLIVSEQWPGGPANDVEQQTFDAAGQLISVSRNAGNHWVEQTYQYAPSGRVSGVTLPDGTQALLGYDLLGRRFSHQSPDTGKTVYLLDAFGNERQRTLATGQLVRSEVDASNRVTQIFHDGETTPRIAYEYFDAGGPAPSDGITANRAGRLWNITDELGAVTLQYEDSGRITNSTRIVAATKASFTEQYVYDALGRTTSTTLPSTTGAGSGRTVEYEYGADGRLSTASDVVTAATYDLFGRPTSLKYGNGTQTILDYRPNGGALSRVQVLDASGTVIRDVTASISEALVTGITSANSADTSVGFSYDGLKRLTTANYEQGSSAADAYAWTYDDNFTVTASTGAGTLAYKTGTHQLSSLDGTTVSYDAAGRMTSGRFGEMVFDSSDHLSQLTTPGGEVVAHTYGYIGLRVQTVTAGSQTYLAPTDNFVIQGGQSVAWISFGPIKLAAEVNGALTFLHGNALGNMDLITDSSGNEASRILQNPYGLTRPQSGPSPTGSAETVALLLSGGDSTGLVCLGHRWYDPLAAQFISPDPFVTTIYTIGVWNPYLYCLGNPVSLADPSGCSFKSVMEIVGLALLVVACVALAIVGVEVGIGLLYIGYLSAGFMSTGMFVSVLIGTFGGAIAGELAAQKAGGSVWAGAFVGGILGGVSSLAGGALGSVVASGLKGLPLLEYVVSGAVQGAVAGAGSGLAVGYAGGAGNASKMWHSVEIGAMWGASLGAILGLGAYLLVGSAPAGSHVYAQLFNIPNKYFADPQTGFMNFTGSVDNDLGIGNDIGMVITAPGLGTGLGFVPDFVGVQPSAVALGFFWDGGSLINIPLGWVPSVALNGGAFASAVDVSFAADQAGFSYADQVTLLLKAAPLFLDYALTLFQEGDVSDYQGVATSFNKFFGSSDTGEYS